MVSRYGVLVMVAVLACVVLVWVGGIATAPVSIDRLERFARRQRLHVTATNGVLVVRSLTITRRWRSLGLAVGVILGMMWALRDARLTLNFSTAFIGWFVGAVIAEWRLAGLAAADGPRSASLTRRTLSSYLQPASAAVLLVVCAGLVVTFLAVLVRSAGTHAEVLGDAVLWIVVAAGGLTAVALTLRRVVARPQATTDPELRAADDALRARSTNVLVGSAIVAAGFPAAHLLILMGVAGPPDRLDTWAGFGLLALLLTLVTGWLVAIRSSPARTPTALPRQVATTP